MSCMCSIYLLGTVALLWFKDWANNSVDTCGQNFPGGGGGTTAIYGLYRYVPL